MSGITNIRSALETALNSMNPALATAWENAPFTPISGTPYQAVNLLFAKPDNPTFGGNMYREQGIFQITLFYPLQAGPANAAARAELLRTTFARGLSFINGGITTIIKETPEISPGSVDGDRWMVPVKIRFFANIVQ